MDKRFADTPAELFEEAREGFNKGDASTPLATFLLGVAYGYRFKQRELEKTITDRDRAVRIAGDKPHRLVQRNKHRRRYPLL